MGRTLEPQDRISRYSVVGPLGAGGMGEVYVAKDETLDRHVALKVLPPSLVRNEERVRRFIIEAKSASSLNHPNIVTIYDIGQDRVRVAGASEDPDPKSDPVHFISMELVTGESLSHKIHEESADLRTLLGYLAQAAEGVAKAHAAGIVHRDLKPGNIMVSKDGFAKVLDFGLAKLTEKQAATSADATNAPTELPATGEGVIMGTAGYMSPEQVQGKPVDARSDIFSLGCVVYEAATRKRPFAADTDVEVMHRILRDRPTAVEELNPKVPTDVRRIIRRCLAKNPDDRFQSMKDLAIELREAHLEYESLPVSGSAAATAPTGTAGAPAKSQRGMLAGLAFVVLVTAGVGGAYLHFGRKASSGASSVAPLADMKMTVLMSRDDIEAFVISNDGRYLAYVTNAEEKSSLNVRQIRTGGDARILPAQEFPIQGVNFSLDGDYVYYLNRDPQLPNYQALFQMPSLGGPPRKIVFDVDTAAAFSPDGSQVCFRRGRPNENRDTLVIADVATGKDRELVRSPDFYTAAPAWSPDGKHIAAANRSNRDGMRAWISMIDVDSGKQERIDLPRITGVDSLAWLPDGSGLIASAVVAAAPVSQIYRVSYPDGSVRRLTNDLNGYTGLSLASAGKSIAAMRKTDVSNVWMAAADGSSEARPVTTATGSSGSATRPAPLPDGTVVYTDFAEGTGHLWRVTPGDPEPRKILTQGVRCRDPRSAGKAGILFTVVADGEFAPHVWRADADGSAPRPLTQGKGELLQDVSPDGSTALYMNWSDAAAPIWAMNSSTGGDVRQIADASTGDPPLISPDGKRILYREFTTVEGMIGTEYVIVALEGGAPQARFVLPPSATPAVWAPDSKSVTYFDQKNGWNLMRRSTSGGESTQLTRFTDGITFFPEWSPDGSRVAFIRRIGPKRGLWTLQPGKGEPKLLAEFRSGAITDLRFSPDSKNVFFTYGTSTKDVVLISDFQ